MSFHEYPIVPFETRDSPRNCLASPQRSGGHWVISTRIPVGSTQLHAGCGIRELGWLLRIGCWLMLLGITSKLLPSNNWADDTDDTGWLLCCSWLQIKPTPYPVYIGQIHVFSGVNSVFCQSPTRSQQFIYSYMFNIWSTYVKKNMFHNMIIMIWFFPWSL